PCGGPSVCRARVTGGLKAGAGGGGGIAYVNLARLPRRYIRTRKTSTTSHAECTQRGARSFGDIRSSYIESRRSRVAHRDRGALEARTTGVHRRTRCGDAHHRLHRSAGDVKEGKPVAGIADNGQDTS